jgi:hypothetical protein
MHLDPHVLRLGRWSAVAILVGALLAACSSSSKPNSNQPRAPKDTSNAALTLAGDSTIAGAVGSTTVNCSYPTIDGVRINAAGQSKDPNTSATISIGPKVVTVRLSSGSGPSYQERDFTGTAGVTGFDAARGAHLAVRLREVARPKGVTAGSIPKVTSLTGQVDCGTQNIGKSTVAVTGKTGDGTLTGPLKSVRVACFAAGSDNYVVIRGIGKVGSIPAEIYVNAQPARFVVGITPKTGKPRSYSSDVYATSLPTDVGLSVKGDAVESDGISAANTVHVEGGATCGNAPAT